MKRRPAKSDRLGPWSNLGIWILTAWTPAIGVLVLVAVSNIARDGLAVLAGVLIGAIFGALLKAKSTVDRLRNASVWSLMFGAIAVAVFVRPST